MAEFSGFGPQALGFLKALGFHQDKAWYEDNKAIYASDIKAPLEALVADLTAELARSGPPLRGDARSLFRLHRDTRFAKDKRPYKTNAGAVLTRDGQKWNPGLLYIHVDPEGCFAAAGFYRLDPDPLRAMRTRIARDGAAFRKLVKALGKRDLVLAEGDALARNPKGFEDVTEEDLSAALRRRHFTVRRAIEAEALASPDLTARIAAFARDTEPLLRFGWEAIG